MAKKQIIFRLEEETYQQLQIYAIRNKTSVQKIVEEYILELLKKGTTIAAFIPIVETRGFRLR